ncbi:MAG: ABC-2 family transporter protein [Anaerolineae bacterium]|jgi:ABC-2 type transport system permease protein|nr:ABC-2 family transporter protein [Anaerolineae bacterium]
MISVWGFYRARFKTALAVQLQYRVALAIWMLGLVLEPIIYLSVWTAVAAGSGGVVNGFTVSDFAAYYIVLLVVQHFTQIWHMWEFDWVIRQGILSGRLLRPIHPIHNDAAENIMYKLLMLVVVVPSVVLLVLLFQPVLNPPLWSALAFVPALLLAGVLAFLVGWCVALAAFWTTRTFAINQVYFIAMFFFSGQVAPLALMPPLLQTLATLLPFRWMVAFPTELLLGRLTVEAALAGFAAQAGWIALSAVFTLLAWRAGIKRYTAMGG